MILADEIRTIAPSDGERLSLIAEGNVTIVETGSGSFTIDLTVKENARVQYFLLSKSVRAERHARLKRDASILWVEATLGGGASTVITQLDGEGADAKYKSVVLGKNEENFALMSRMIHNGNHSTSDMHTRAVMFDKSVGKYEGLIKIDSNASECDAYQKQDTLLMSDDARMDATPNLEISNEHVKCSHGVSLGQIDEEKLFYCKARGLPEEKAVALIVHGFFDEILTSMGEHGKSIKEELFASLEVAT